MLSFMTALLMTCCAPASTDITGTITVQPRPAEQPLLMTSQLIIKFRDPGLDPSRSDFVQELSRTAHAALVYVRPMSGGAHVFRVENISNTTLSSEVIQRLSKRPDILNVEQDEIMHHQQMK
jgi:hypothetical protein